MFSILILLIIIKGMFMNLLGITKFWFLDDRLLALSTIPIKFYAISIGFPKKYTVVFT